MDLSADGSALVVITTGYLGFPFSSSSRTSSTARHRNSDSVGRAAGCRAIAALLSTSSAVNATLFGASNVSYQIARDGQLPATFIKARWNRHIDGLFITAGLSIVFVLAFDLGPIAMMASAAFLVVYAAVNAAHLKVRSQTGARTWVVAASLVACSAMFVLLMVYIVRKAPAAAWITLLATLAAAFVTEVVYRARTGRRYRTLAEAAAPVVTAPIVASTT
jgi:amino acid transporter